MVLRRTTAMSSENQSTSTEHFIILNSYGRVCISLLLDNTPHQHFPLPLAGAPHRFMRWNIRISLVESGFWVPRLSDNGEAEDNLNISPGQSR
jgi:hypothetical protein